MGGQTRLSGALYAGEDQLLVWFAHAAPGGAWTRYAVGEALDPSHPVVRQVSEWRASGSVEHEERETPVGTAFHVRRPALIQAAASASVGTKAEQLLDLLDRAAQEGMPCPSYTAVAKVLGLRDRQVARHLFTKLRKAGKVHVDGAGQSRRVMLTTTGAVLRAAFDSS
jgi:hypothetical protein